NRFVCQQQRNEIMKSFLICVNYFFNAFLKISAEVFLLPDFNNPSTSLCFARNFRSVFHFALCAASAGGEL
ncbi:hypothetical protein, partial [Herbaspirillum sp.]|uniref:hypothetical protein n=1 Tax=Herbaspirillum sp. TaxID=1890675 RepID=UPI001B0565A3